jgi:ketosteroid isomerase-like protein
VITGDPRSGLDPAHSRKEAVSAPSRDNLELVQAAFAAFAAGDVDAFNEVYAPDVVHTMPGTSQVSGAHRGLPAVLTFYGRLAELSNGTIRVEPETFYTDGEQRVLVVFHTTAERNGRRLDIREGVVITIADDKIVAIDGYQEDLEGYAAFWE